MTPTRRDVLKMAAVLPAMGAAISRSDALAALAQPIGLEPAPYEDHPDALFDPASFADSIYRGTLGNMLLKVDVNHAATSLNTYKRARFALLQVMPELGAVAFDHPFVKMDEAALAVWAEGYWEGVRTGAALENLRRAVIGPMQACLTCDGLGLVDERGQHFWNLDSPAFTKCCPTCGGHGLVAAESLEGQASETIKPQRPA
jgi:hypothetical protein